MEASLRDLLERLDGIAAGTARSHDTPTHLVEEVKEVLEHLASDELPAASAVFLSKDHPGALRHLEDARARGKPSAAANAGRAKLFELIAWYLTRLDAEAVEPYAEAVMRECLRTFRTERGTQKTVKAAALAPLASLLRLGATRLSRDETRALACELREDYERHTANTARVKGMLLSVIAAMHDCGVSASAPDGPLSREREEEEEEDEDDFPRDGTEAGSGNDRGSKPAPDPRWPCASAWRPRPAEAPPPPRRWSPRRSTPSVRRRRAEREKRSRGVDSRERRARPRWTTTRAGESPPRRWTPWRFPAEASART